jgi:hypothetical protein
MASAVAFLVAENLGVSGWGGMGEVEGLTLSCEGRRLFYHGAHGDTEELGLGVGRVTEGPARQEPIANDQ